MEDKIKNLTDKIYNEGVVKARDEAEKIMHEARHKADGLLADAQKQAEMIISKATSDAEEVSSNIREEIRHASNQAINIIKQKVGELITLSITDRPLKELVNDQQFILDTVKLMMDQWGASGNRESITLVLPESLDKDAADVITKKIHEQFGNKINIALSHKMNSGFRISPEGSNYLISFTEKDFSSFFHSF
ncbi:MAG: hypothetical protein IPJ13_08890 [Saprospiraceae bacterium]|nr:hypothetical protein [Saprospiraceae bacterium]